MTICCDPPCICTYTVSVGNVARNAIAVRCATPPRALNTSSLLKIRACGGEKKKEKKRMKEREKEKDPRQNTPLLVQL